MTPQPQSPNHPSIHGNQQNISGHVAGPVVGGNVGHIGDVYVLPADRPPLWIDVPSLPAHFLGRDAIVADLSARLTAGGSVALSAEGKPGVGKTTLAVALAHHREVLAHFSDGVLWAGLGPQPDLPSRLARWADALGVDVSDRPTVEARAQAVRDAIGHKRLLLVIDDAWQLEAAEHLRCGGPNCAHLLTSRDQGLAFAFAGRSERVAELTPTDALELLRRLAPKAVAVDEAQATGLLAAVGYLPLAVELLGGYLAAGASARFADASRSALADLTDPARRLALATRRLGDGSGRRMSLEEVIGLSIDGLAEESPAAVDAFYSLGAFAPKPANFDLLAAQAVAECDADALALLIERNLLEQDDDESLALHQTLADVARSRTPAEAVTRHREHYLALVNADREDWQSIEVVYPQIQWAWQQATKKMKVAVEFVDALAFFQTRRYLWGDRLAWIGVIHTNAQDNLDWKLQARLLNEKGVAYSALGENDKALVNYEEALLLYHKLQDTSGPATILNNIGLLYTLMGEREKALTLYTKALSLWPKVEEGGWSVGLSVNTLAEIEVVLPLFRRKGKHEGAAAILNNMGRVYDSLDDKKRALANYEQTLPMFRYAKDRGGEALALHNIASVYDTLGDRGKALEYYVSALPLFHQVGDRIGEATTLNNISKIYAALGDLEKSLQSVKQGLLLRMQMGDRSSEIKSRRWIATLHESDGDFTAAIAELEIALSIATEVRSPNAAAIARQLDQLRAAQ